MGLLGIQFLRQVVQELDGSDVTAIGLTGSHARNSATPYSDVDIYRFVQRAPEAEEEQYQLRMIEGYLVSISTTSIRAKRAELTRPEQLIYAVPGLRQMRILLDKRGELAALKRDVDPFNWRLFQPAADSFASYQLMGLAEEVHKLLGGLHRGDEGAMLYGTIGLTLGLARAVAVQRGLFIDSENTYFAQVMNLFEPDSDWVRCFRAAVGLDATFNDEPVTVSVRAFFALNLYSLTGLALRDIVRIDHAEVILRAVERIETLEYHYNRAHVSLTRPGLLPREAGA